MLNNDQENEENKEILEQQMDHVNLINETNASLMKVSDSIELEKSRINNSHDEAYYLIMNDIFVHDFFR